jgi:hypothetical protein
MCGKVLPDGDAAQRSEHKPTAFAVLERQMSIDDASFFQALRPLTARIEASGFRPIEEHSPTWLRELVPERLDRVVLWRHPRQPTQVHGYLASSQSPAMLHLRLLDPSWCPQQVLPGHLGKGWDFADVDELEQLAATLAQLIWPRALAWFEAPIPGDELLASQGRVASGVLRGELLEQHRRRAAWLEQNGEHQEALYVRGVVEELEAILRHQSD